MAQGLHDSMNEVIESRHYDESHGVDGAVLTCTRVMDFEWELDFVSTPGVGDLWESEDYSPPSNKLWVTHVATYPKLTPTIARCIVTYSSAGIGQSRDIDDTEEFLETTVSETKKWVRDTGGSLIQVTSLKQELIYGRTIWRKKIPLRDGKELAGRTNRGDILIGGETFPERSLLLLPVSASRVGNERWRVTYRWKYDPDLHRKIDHNGVARDWITRVDMSDLFK